MQNNEQNPQVNQISKKILDIISSNSNGSNSNMHEVILQGDPASGKSSVLRSLESVFLEQKKLFPILISPPTQQVDSGQIALLTIGVKIDEHYGQNEVLKYLKNPQNTWDSKINKVGEFFSSHSDKLVLLIDEPDRWSSQGDDQEHFSERTSDFVQFLVRQVNLPKVFTGKIKTHNKNSHFLDCKLNSRTDSWLTNQGEWGNFVSIATMLNQKLGSALTEMSPLHIRLLIGIATVSGVEHVESHFQDVKTRPEASTFLLKLLRAKKMNGAIELLKSLSFVRLNITDQLLNHLGFSSLSENEQFILKRCFLFPAGQSYELHDSIKMDIRAFHNLKVDSNDKSVHKKLSEYFVENFLSKTNQNSSDTLLANEAFHHLIESGDDTWLKTYQPFFSDQLNYLGYRLSRYEHKYNEAISAFETSLKWDAEDDYAMHYLAYNLDCLAKEPKKVEQLYKSALKKNSNVIRWHTHYINFLIARGRLKDIRAAWQNAKECLMVGNQIQSSDIYNTLHLKVAHTLANRAQYVFALEVLFEVPYFYHSADYANLKNYCKALEKSDLFGPILPLNRIKNLDHPASLREKIEDDFKLNKWGVGSIVSNNEDALEAILIISELNSETKTKKLSKLKVQKSELPQWFDDKADKNKYLDIGTLIEVGIYVKKGSAVQTKLRIIKSKPDTAFKKAFPDPDRYLKNLA